MRGDHDNARKHAVEINLPCPPHATVLRWKGAQSVEAPVKPQLPIHCDGVISIDGSLKPVLAVASPRVGVVRTHNGGSPGRACPRAGGGRPGGRPCGGLRARLKIGRAHVELQSLMSISYAVFCLKHKKKKTRKSARHPH